MDFFDECKRRYNVGLWKIFCSVFDCMPISGIVADSIFCTHGGLSPLLVSMDQIKNLSRPLEISEKTLVSDLLWADPEPSVSGWGPNDRGISYVFGPDIVDQFLAAHNLSLVCRAHQVVEDGFEFFNQRKLLTIFSAPNYCGEFNNHGGMLMVDEAMTCSIKVIPPGNAPAKKDPVA